MTQMHLGWHFCAMKDGVPLLRDGSPLEIGRTYEHVGPLQMCHAGYHDAPRVIDALKYAPGPYLCRTLASRDQREGDKHVSRYRVALRGFDVTIALYTFAAKIAFCALLAEREAGREPHADSWAAVRARMEWLAGRIDDDALYAAWNTAWNTTGNTTWDAAWDAAESVARNVARNVAKNAAESLLLAELPGDLIDPARRDPS